MKRFIYLLMLALPLEAFAQFTLVSTSPANNATNVPLNVVMTFTFSAPVDTNSFNGEHGFTNAAVQGQTFSADAKTLYLSISLEADHAYFVSMFWAKAKDGTLLQSPFVVRFTTGSTFPPYSVSGTLSSGATGVSVQNSVVALSTTEVMKSDKPAFVAWANVNTDGSFTIPYVPNGTYYPVAVKDVNRDGDIKVEDGTDVIALHDPIVVNNASVTNLALAFMSITPLTLADAIPVADSLARSMPSDRTLKQIRAYQVDGLGRATEWNFYYAILNNTTVMQVRVQPMGSRVDVPDTYMINTVIAARPLGDPRLAAASPAVMANVESSGGKAFRDAPHADSLTLEVTMVLGDMTQSEFGMMNPEANRNYWGVMYSLNVETQNQWNMYRYNSFLCDVTTGSIVRVTSAKNEIAALPTTAMLAQNYPNPFNPSTRIEYQIAERAHVRLEIVDMLGRTAAVLVNEEQAPGRKSVEWNASGMASGMYFYRLTAGTFTDLKKMMLVK